MSKLRIAHICWNCGGHQEGISRSVTRLAEHQALDWDVHVFAANSTNVADVTLHQIKLNWFDRRLPFVLGFARASARTVRADGPFDILHAHVPTLARADAATVHLFPPQQLVKMVRDMLRRTGQPLTKDIEKQFRRARLAGWCYARNMGPPTQIIAVSKAVMRQVASVYKLPLETITRAPLGADPQAQTDNIPLRTNWGFPPERPIALFAGHQYVTKGLGFVLEALAALGPRAPALVVVGEGSEGSLAAMQTQVKRLGLEAVVRFEGLQEDITPYLHATDFLVYPTFFDTFGLIITEALAAGKPVITTKAAGVVEELASTDPLIVLDSPENVAELAQALETLAHNPQIRTRLSNAAPAALQPLSWDRHAEIVAGVYHQILAKKNSTHPKESP